MVQKRKRVIGAGEDPKSKKKMLEVETIDDHDEMDIVGELN